MLYCYTCGYGNQDEARFCYSCGRVTQAAVEAIQTPASSVPAENTPKTAIAGLILAIVGLGEAAVALFIPYDGGFIAIFCVAISVFLCIRSLNTSRNTRIAMTGVVCNGVAIWIMVAGFSLLFLGVIGDSGGNTWGGLKQRSFTGDGIYIVGEDIAPGVYGSVGIHNPLLGNCEFVRFGKFDEVLQSGAAGYHRVLVIILPSDEAFYTDNCGRWTVITD